MKKGIKSTAKITFLVLGLIVLFFSCKDKQKQVESNPTVNVVDSNDNVISKDSIVPPKVTFVDESRLKKITLLPPEIKNLPEVSRYTDGSLSSDQSASGLGLFTTFDTDNGLALDALGYGKSILCDSNGNLWFGTQGGGVSKYDGKSFTSFTTSQGLAANSVLSIAEDKSGNLWFGTEGGGVSKYDGKSFITFTTEQGLASNIVRSIAEDKKGVLWFGTQKGVSKYEVNSEAITNINNKEKNRLNNSFTNFTTAQGLASNYVLSIAEDKEGNLWFGTYQGGVSKYDGKSFTTFTTEQGLAGNYVLSITEDKNGNLWFGTYEDGVSKYDGKSFTTFTTDEGLAANNVLSIAEDKRGNLWIGTQGGVSKYEENANTITNTNKNMMRKSFTTFTTAQGLAGNSVRSIAEDKSGNLWFGTQGGLSKYAGQSFITFTTAQGLAANSVWSIAEDKRGNLWFGTEEGVSKYDGKSFTTFTTSQGLAANSVWSISEAKNGDLWFGTQGGGVSKYDGKSFTTFTTAQGLVTNSVLSIAEDKKGNLWFGTQGGVSKYDGKSFTTFTTAQGLPANNVWSIVEDKIGNLWFGTQGGVAKYDGKSFTTFTTAQGLAANGVLSIIEDKNGNLWFGTEAGLSLMPLAKVKDQQKQENTKSVDNKNEKIFLNYTKNQGLPDDYISAVREGSHGNILLGSNFGICMIPAKEATRITNSSDLTGVQNLYGLEVYNQFTGYSVRDVNTGANNGAMLVDSRGIIWVGHGSNGITRIDPDAVYKNHHPPPVIIKSVKINEENICWYILGKYEKDSATRVQQEIITYGSLLTDGDRDSIRQKYSEVCFDSIARFYPLPVNLVLPYRHNNITFDFVAIETGRNFMVRYQYMLVGYDKGWSPVTDKTSATFGNIYEGTYTFKLKARSYEGVWSEPVIYTFEVFPPWWRTWWMYSAYAIFAIGMVVLIVWWNSRRLIARAKELKMEVDKATIVIRNQKTVVETEKKKSDELLLNILPEEVADELKRTGTANAKQFNEVTVMFTDFVNFTGISQQMSPKDLVAEIHQKFSAFDNIISKHGLEKIKTIGDAYMAVCGLPVETPDHAQKVINAALEIRDYVAQSQSVFQIRIGINSGAVVAGIVGVKKYAYDIWGDTVNTASRMESNSEQGKINISGSTYELVKDKYSCENRGKITVKGKGEIAMYFVEK